MTRKKSYSIGALADAAGVSRRTVRFYVQRGLLAPPEGLGRGASYTDDHLASLLQIKGWQEQGVPLEEVRARMTGALERRATAGRGNRARADGPLAASAPASRAAPSWGAVLAGTGPDGVPYITGSAWIRQPLAAGVELHVSAARRPLTPRQLAALARALGEILEDEGEEE